MRRALLVAMSIALGVLVSCGGSSGGHAGHAETQDEHAAAAGSVPGEPADASDATETVEVSTLDQLRFDPASIEVAAGDVITFVVTNEGSTDHEFVLGDEAYQRAHGSGGEHDMSGENAVTVGPGETEELTWRFEESGEVLYGCHIDGHYDGGMVGKVDVS